MMEDNKNLESYYDELERLSGLDADEKIAREVAITAEKAERLSLLPLCHLVEHYAKEDPTITKEGIVSPQYVLFNLSFKNEKRAKEFLGSLESAGYAPFRVHGDNPQNHGHAVRFGGTFSDEDITDALQKMSWLTDRRIKQI